MSYIRLLTRRRFMAVGAALLALPQTLRAREYRGGIPWTQKEANPPVPYDPGNTFLLPSERSFLVAAVDRLIPRDEYPSASELGVVDFIDDQLAGDFGRGDMYYLHPPFMDGLESQGYQSEAPALLYRRAIAAIEAHVSESSGTGTFAQLEASEQDRLLQSLENGDVTLPDVDGQTFFSLLLQNTMEGYFGDPLYGGNRDMQGWKMLGFPGARYDYRPYVDKHNQALQLIPISILPFTSRDTTDTGVE